MPIAGARATILVSTGPRVIAYPNADESSRHRHGGAGGEHHQRGHRLGRVRDAGEEQHAHARRAAHAVDEPDPERLRAASGRGGPRSRACGRAPRGRARAPRRAGGGGGAPTSPWRCAWAWKWPRRQRSSRRSGEHHDHHARRRPRPRAAAARAGTPGAARSAARRAASVSAWPAPHARPSRPARRVPSSGSDAISVDTAARWSGSDAWRSPSSSATSRASAHAAALGELGDPVVKPEHRLVPPRPQPRARHGELPVGDAAVVRRQQLGHQHAQAVALEPARACGPAACGSGTRRRTGRRSTRPPRSAARPARRSPSRRRGRCGTGRTRPAPGRRAPRRARPRGSSGARRGSSGSPSAARRRAAADRRRARPGRPPPRAQRPPAPRSSPRTGRRTARPRRRRAGRRSS